jgi:hypothetical protein
MDTQPNMRRRRRRTSGISGWSIVGGLAALAVAALIATNLQDIKRYIRISTM